MRAYGESSAVEVGDQALFVIHGSERGWCIHFVLLFEQWAGGADGALDLPERVAAVEGQFRVSGFGFRGGMGLSRKLKLETRNCIQRADLRESSQFVFTNFWNTACQVVNGFEWSHRTCAQKRFGGVFAQAADVAQSHAQGNGFPGVQILGTQDSGLRTQDSLQRAIPL